jgi:hypothetical protein
MFENKGHIDYILGGRENPFSKRKHALNVNSISNDWVAVAIQNSEMGKATGICLLNVLNRPITKKIFSVLRDRTVEAFSIAISVSIHIVIAVSKFFQPFTFLMLNQVKGAFK